MRGSAEENADSSHWKLHFEPLISYELKQEIRLGSHALVLHTLAGKTSIGYPCQPTYHD